MLHPSSVKLVGSYHKTDTAVVFKVPVCVYAEVNVTDYFDDIGGEALPLASTTYSGNTYSPIVFELDLNRLDLLYL